ncbi:hypothetical protein [Arthrobacter sp. Soil736]|uniref:hypothetical protein n=1 Tax=Arthrobacter sp. Soil736 TaxID=1736395 RepID=UPI0019104952|nr:hypothetical protein [Arthrobacter sp. Soil736]
MATQKIASAAGVAGSVVRYHLAIAAKQDPGIREEHKAALPVSPQRLTAAGRWNLEDVLAFYKTEGRLPIFSRSAREKARCGCIDAVRTQRRAPSPLPTLTPWT